ncbi:MULTISPECIES: EamA family transporter [Sphingobacterium]|jgi:drug/metabolite transporter (DMT)-like permease|uniref:EamA family transporter n=2 Tax=Sphingobacterium TaxID=28453 RepID=A0ACD5C0D2_9SPHI|nr:MULTISPECIES: EamA family transporter [Sphingobacterium]MDF2853658.1 transporter [Sphingobacterium multivorum]QQT60208.1 EamA/RhaT family transporter [Sphingobacterium multivorum]QRQ60116.1 EamA/RhaT family transporter [Sphingobacterium multivorum]SPZ92002.1 EamA-like transporter family [Sphingobacterium multivorum]
MIFVLLSVICSVTVAVLLKLAKQNGVETKQVIVWNYPMAVALTYFVLQPDLKSLVWDAMPMTLYMSLAILLPGMFVFIALSIRYSGLVKTEIAQRLSLFIPLLASFFFFHEKMEGHKMLGIALGLLAILCSIGWQKNQHVSSADSRYKALYPLLVFIGMGIIDILFKQVALHVDIPYISSLFIIFVMAMSIAMVLLLYFLFVEKQRFSRQAMGYGLVLGVFNFCNILFYMKAHRALPENPSVVFTGMNIGVISLGALIGVLFFKERLSLLNYLGIALSIVSVLIIAYL